MASLFNMNRNLSLYTIPAAWLLAIMPHSYAAALAGKAFDAKQPRTLNETVQKDQTLDAATKRRIIRAEAAQTNGFENLGFYAAAIVAATAAGVEPALLNSLSLGYLASRVVYNLVYINNETGTLAKTRSLVYLSGVGMIVTLYVKAANLVRLRAAI